MNSVAFVIDMIVILPYQLYNISFQIMEFIFWPIVKDSTT